MIPTVHAIYFSPTRSTAKIVKAVASAISSKLEIHDLTNDLSSPISIAENAIAVVGVPCYSGRVPEVAMQRLATIKANGTPVILVCVYGNRAFEDTLLELNNICSENGFITISAGAFIAKHGIFPEVANTRPDKNDMEKAQQLGQQSLQCWLTGAGKGKQISLPGNYPYRERGKMPFPFQIQVNNDCNDCGKCIDLCPVGAIDKNDSTKIDPYLCIACARCIQVCRQHARSFGGETFAATSQGFAQKNSARKEIELFFPEA